MGDEDLVLEFIGAVFGLHRVEVRELIAKSNTLSGWESGEALAEALLWRDEVIPRLRIELIRNMRVADLQEAIGGLGVRFDVKAG